MAPPRAQKTGELLDFKQTPRKNKGARAVHATATQPTAAEWRAEERLFLQLFENSPQPMSITSFVEGRYLDVNDSFLSLLGYTRAEVIGETSLNLGIWVNSEQRAQLVKLLSRHGRVKNFETTLRGKGGRTRVWLSSAEVVELDGERCILVSSNDITDRKRAEEALREISAQLIKAQEEERSRIARELHDGLNQRLALLCVDLEQFSASHRGIDRKGELRTLATRLQDASSEVHALSHQLHPSKLDHLGLVPAVKSLCREWSGRRRLRIEFHASPSTSQLEGLDRDLALCAYRVIQEALTNVIKHAGASWARVDLKCKDGQLYASITDSGSGFDVAEAKLKGRLGLVSMEERLRLANGQLEIRSNPMRGTQIEARIPLTGSGDQFSTTSR
jgi:PAS domain S-box-containing protein